MRGKFVVIDGGEAAGKTTQLELLKTHLISCGKEVVTVREPGGTAVGEEIRKLLLNPESKMNMRCETLLYMAARAQLVFEVIKPTLETGKWVLADRFVSSTIAYQTVGQDTPFIPADITFISGLSLSYFTPDLTIILDVSWETAQQRLTGKVKDRIERRSEAYHRSVLSRYRDLEGLRYAHLDGGKSIEETAKGIRDSVKPLLL